VSFTSLDNSEKFNLLNDKDIDPKLSPLSFQLRNSGNSLEWSKRKWIRWSAVHSLQICSVDLPL